MKNLVSVALLTLATVAARAQTPLTKGRGMLTGSINYHQDSGNSTAFGSSSFSVAPAAGYFIANNLLLGLSLSYQAGNFSQLSYSPVGTPAPLQYSNRTISVGPFARYYRFVGGDKFALFGQASLGYTHLNEAYYYGAYGNRGYASFTPGMAFFPVSRFGIEASLRGLSLVTDFQDNSTLDLGISLRDFQLGASYYFGK